jgi:acyl-CoA synthetase (AMP-forming)/AMP-acid ligase II
VLERAGRVDHSFPRLEKLGAGGPSGADADPSDEAAVLFTSGATGPAKGVLYRHRQVRAQLELIRKTYRLTGDDRIVAAFAPFALFGPALGLPSVVPRTDVTRPGKLTAAALGEAAVALGATVVFASPAALRNVVATSAGLSPEHRLALSGVRLLMSAGASVPAALLRRVQELLPNAELHTPYGMTEALPLTDISLAEIDEAGNGQGVCVGRPLSGVTIGLAPLDRAGVAGAELTTEPGVEIWASAEHIRDRYDAAWVVDAAAAAHPGWHRTGDVGHLDERGRLWVEGRAVHIITSADGPVTPVGIELRVQAALDAGGLSSTALADVAAVGVGPAGTQQVVVVLAGKGAPLAPTAVTDIVRAAAAVPVAAVLVIRAMPVDIRHNSKIDRVAVGDWAAGVLSGG